MRKYTAVLVLSTVMGLALFASPGVRAAEPVEGVRSGLDVLVQEQFKSLAGRKIGLVTNHTAIDQQGRGILELFHAAPDVKLVAIFSPEHGLKGQLDERVADSTDPLTGLKVFSLYGQTRRPSAEMLEGVDTLVFDIQDIGARFYTYIATLGMCMEEAAKAKIRFVVLDRPNPITGVQVFGPLNERQGEFTAYHLIPVVHGMTVGELAEMYNVERKINCELVVVKMTGWKRSMWYDATGLRWVNPSPNMRSLTEATLYPAVGLLEATNLSVGRGTDTPFELFGAPWVEERPLAAQLNALGLPGLRFVPIRFTPNASKFKGEECGGVNIIVTDRNALEPIEAGLAMARELKALHGEKFSIQAVNNLLFNQKVLDAVKAADKPQRFGSMWDEDLKGFMAVRAKYLLYE